MRTRAEDVRRLILALLAVLAAAATTPADAQQFHAGLTRIAVADAAPFAAWIAYPTDQTEVSFAVDPFELTASRDAQIAAGDRFPIVLFSHGNGRAGGSALVHRELLLQLARAGFIVVAPSHPAMPQPFATRPRQIRAALDALLADARFAAHADRERIGMIGYSFGGAVALIAAGAPANLAHLSRYCREHADDARACEGIPTDGSLAQATGRRSPDAVSLRALVLLEPYGAPFDRAGLEAVTVPVLIYRALQSDLRAEGNALAIAAALPRAPHLEEVPGGHLVFVDPCPPRLAEAARDACVDAPGIDRVAIHRQLEQVIVDFLHQTL
jgi:predicted dienelactone hydrolase